MNQNKSTKKFKSIKIKKKTMYSENWVGKLGISIWQILNFSWLSAANLIKCYLLGKLPSIKVARLNRVEGYFFISNQCCLLNYNLDYCEEIWMITCLRLRMKMLHLINLDNFILESVKAMEHPKLKSGI